VITVWLTYTEEPKHTWTDNIELVQETRKEHVNQNVTVRTGGQLGALLNSVATYGFYEMRETLDPQQVDGSFGKDFNHTVYVLHRLQ
jgi:hypothetical protein